MCRVDIEPTHMDWKNCYIQYEHAKHQFNHHSRPKKQFSSPHTGDDFGSWRIKVEDFLSSSFSQMAYVLNEVTVQKEPVHDNVVACRFPNLHDAAGWSQAIGAELRALTEGESFRLIRN